MYDIVCVVQFVILILSMVHIRKLYKTMVKEVLLRVFTSLLYEIYTSYIGRDPLIMIFYHY